MNRRKFLQSMGITLAVASMPAVAIATLKKRNYANFNPELEYGDCWDVTDLLNKRSFRIFKRALRPDMELVVPPEFRNKVTWEYRNPKPMDADPLSQRGQLWWKYSKKHPARGNTK